MIKPNFGSSGSIDANLRDLERDQKGRLWAASESEGLFRVDNPTNSTSHVKQYLPNGLPFSLGDNKVFDTHIDSRGRIWAGTERAGLHLFVPEEDGFLSFVSNPSRDYALKTNSIWKVFEDAGGRLWLGSNNQGFFVHDPWARKFNHVTQGRDKDLRLKFNTVTSFCEVDESTIWVGTDGGGISIWDREANVYRFLNHDPSDESTLGSDAVLSMFQDSQQRTWVGTWNGGLNLYNPSDESFATLRRDENNPSLASDNVFAIDEDAEGRLWIATWGNGLTRYDPENEEYFHLKHVKYSDEFLTDALTYDVEVDHLTGDVWVATVYGVDRVRVHEDDSFDIFHYKNDTIPPLKISDWYGKTIFQDSEDRIWIGTLSGLNLYDRDNESFQIFRQKDGLSSDDIMAIEEDGDGNLWISTDNGLTKMWNDQVWRFEIYDQADGLQAKEFFRNASYRTSSGELFFGGVNGFNHFIPDQVNPYRHEGPIQLTSLKIFNKEAPIGGDDGVLAASLNTLQEITLSHDQNIFSIGFGVVNFTHAGEQQFAYKLEGLEDEWNYVGKQTSATYSNLEGGEYKFLVKAANHDGVWSKEPRVLLIRMLPPWWKTWWAQVIFYTGLVILTLSVFQIRLAAVQRQKAMLARQVAERTSEVLTQKEALEHQAQKLQLANDQKDKLFSIIAHDLRSPLAALQGITELLDPQILEAEDLQRTRQEINKRVRGIGGVMINLLEWARGQMDEETSKIKVCKLQTLAEEVLIGYEAVAEEKGVELHHKFSPACWVYADIDQLRLILRNLVGNAVKFTSRGQQVTLSCAPKDEMMEVMVADNGIGMTGEKLETLFDSHNESTEGTSGERGVGLGLILVKEYVEKNGGMIRVQSEWGKGTTFIFTLPLATTDAPAALETLAET